MKIELNYEKTRFEDVKQGQTFISDGILYQRSDGDGDEYASMRLGDGVMAHFRPETPVRLVEGTFVED